MGVFRRLLNIGVGLGAGYLALKLLGDYNKDRPIEVEFTEVPHVDGEEPAEEQDETEQQPSQMPLGGAAPLQRDEKGHVDPASIVDPADFQDWDDLGCQG